MREPEQVLDRWRDWGGAFTRRPQVIRDLPGGQTNRSYLINGDSQSWVLRTGSPIESALGIDRHRERLILEAAEAAKLSPKVAHCAPEQGLLITAYLGPDHFKIDRNNYAQSCARLFDLIRAIHQLNVNLPAIDYYAHAERYWQRLSAAECELPESLRDARQLIAERRDALCVSQLPARLCHRDIIPGNIIEHGGRLYVLDWEYAACGWQAFDYAALAIEWEIPVTDIVRVSGIDTSLLEHAMSLYRYTCQLWYLVSKFLKHD